MLSKKSRKFSARFHPHWRQTIVQAQEILIFEPEMLSPYISPTFDETWVHSGHVTRRTIITIELSIHKAHGGTNSSVFFRICAISGKCRNPITPADADPNLIEKCFYRVFLASKATELQRFPRRPIGARASSPPLLARAKNFWILRNSVGFHFREKWQKTSPLGMSRRFGILAWVFGRVGNLCGKWRFFLQSIRVRRGVDAFAKVAAFTQPSWYILHTVCFVIIDWHPTRACSRSIFPGRRKVGVECATRESSENISCGLADVLRTGCPVVEALIAIIILY